MTDLALTVVLSVLGILSALFSSSETALFSLEKTSHSRFKRENPLAGSKVLDLISEPSHLLGTLLFANLIINVFFFSLFSRLSFMTDLLGSDNQLYQLGGVVIPIITILIVGEVVPKVFALRFAYKWSLVVVYPITWMRRLLSPFVNVFVKFMPDTQSSADLGSSELEQLVKNSARDGMIHEDESVHLKDLIRFGVLTVEEVMIPRSEMISFCLKDGRDKLKELFQESGLTKIPVYRESPNDIKEVIHVRDFLSRPEAALETITKPIGMCPEQVLIRTLYNRMRLTKQKTMLIVDEFGGTSGIITFKDILEEIVGEFNEGLGVGEVDPAQQINSDQWRVFSKMPFRDFEDLTGRPLPKGRYVTLGGFVLEQLGRMPRKGEEFVLSDVTFKVEHYERLKVMSYIVTLSQNSEVVR